MRPCWLGQLRRIIQMECFGESIGQCVRLIVVVCVANRKADSFPAVKRKISGMIKLLHCFFSPHPASMKMVSGLGTFQGPKHAPNLGKVMINSLTLLLCRASVGCSSPHCSS